MEPRVESFSSKSLDQFSNDAIGSSDSTNARGKSHSFGASSQPSFDLDITLQNRVHEMCKKYVWPDSVTELEPYMSHEAFNEFRIICLLNFAKVYVTEKKTNDVGNETLGTSDVETSPDDVKVEPEPWSMRKQLPPELQATLISYRFKTEFGIGALQSNIYSDQYSIHHGISPFGLALKNIDKDQSFRNLAVNLLPHIPTITPTDLENLKDNIESFSWLLSRIEMFSLIKIPEKLFFQKIDSIFQQHMKSRSFYTILEDSAREGYIAIYEAFHAYAMSYSSSQLTLLHLSQKGFQKFIRAMDRYERTNSYTPSSPIQSLDTKSMFGPNKITAMGHFCAQNDLSMVQELHEMGLSLTYGAPNGRPPIYHAVAEGHVEIVDYLLNNGACDDLPELTVLTEIANQAPQSFIGFIGAIKYVTGTQELSEHHKQTIQRLKAHREALSKAL